MLPDRLTSPRNKPKKASLFPGGHIYLETNLFPRIKCTPRPKYLVDFFATSLAPIHEATKASTSLREDCRAPFTVRFSGPGTTALTRSQGAQRPWPAGPTKQVTSCEGMWRHEHPH